MIIKLIILFLASNTNNSGFGGKCINTCRVQF